MNTLTQLRPGYYAGLQRYPFHNPATGGLDWSGQGRGCNSLQGWFVVDSVTYVNGTLTAIDLRFEQHCEGVTAALHGAIHWTFSDTTPPPPTPVAGPVNPPPAGLWQPAAGSTPATGNYVYLQSDAGDYIGQGQAYTYTSATAALSVTANSGHLAVGINGNGWWSGNFQTMNTLTQLQPGYYAGLQRYPFHNPVTGGLDWSGQGRGCNTLQGWFVVDNVTYVGGTLTAIDLRFEQHCEGVTAALHGAVHWTSTDTTTPSGPVNPPPAGLWQPAAGSTPATGNYVYLQSDAGDYIGQGQTYAYTQATATLSVAANSGHLAVGINGNEWWGGDFQTMNTLTQFQPGYYAGLQRYPGNPVMGGLSWSGQGRGCNTLQGWFVVDNVTYVNGTLTALDLRFEQHCEGNASALHGAIHWTSTDTTTPSGPVNPPPAGLWQPAAGSTPATGNYVYLQSDAGDYIGQGQTYTYTQATAILSVTASSGHLAVGINGNGWWSGDFQTMNTLTQLQPGYYAGLQRYPFHNPATGGLSWSGQGGGCNTLQGWFVVDNVTYVGGTLTAIDLRFEQQCEGVTAALHGAIHWTSTDTTTPSGPVNPPPAGLWQPAAGSTPATGNYVYLQSDAGDYIGQGQTYTYTPASATLSVTASSGHLTVGINGNEQWSGNFQAMNTLTQLQPGYYGGLQRYPFHNPVMGGLSWSGQGRGCNTLQGWFVVDNVTYVNGTLTAIDLRFEQHCEGVPAALHGAIHWTSTDTTTPSGPVNPPPAGLWQPAAGSTPATGNYVYLQSDAGDYIGQGQTYTYTQATATLTLGASSGHLGVGIVGNERWSGNFQAMNTLTQLQPGYYAGLQRYPFHNPATGGLDWSGQGRGCNTLQGWFVVDNVTYVGGTLTAIDLRFEQHCEGVTPALHGAIHWGP